MDLRARAYSLGLHTWIDCWIALYKQKTKQNKNKQTKTPNKQTKNPNPTVCQMKISYFYKFQDIVEIYTDWVTVQSPISASSETFCAKLIIFFKIFFFTLTITLSLRIGGLNDA